MTIGTPKIDMDLLDQLYLEVGGVVKIQYYYRWGPIAATTSWISTSRSESDDTQELIAEQLKVVYGQLLETFVQAYLAGLAKRSQNSPKRRTTSDDHLGHPSVYKLRSEACG